MLSNEAGYNLQDSIVSCVETAHTQGLGAMVENVQECLFLSTKLAGTGKVFLLPPLKMLVRSIERLSVTNLSSENNFANVSTECSSRHQAESERSVKQHCYL